MHVITVHHDGPYSATVFRISVVTVVLTCGSLGLGMTMVVQDLPDQLSRCASLRVLFASDNGIRTLPPSIASWRHLHTLNVSPCGWLGSLVGAHGQWGPLCPCT